MLVVPGHPHELVADHAVVILSVVSEEAALNLHVRDRLFEAVLILEEPVVNTSQHAIRFSAVEGSGPAGVVVLVALVALVASPSN